METTSRRRRPLNQDKDELKRRRFLRGLTQHELAELVGTTQGYISELELGASSAGVQIIHRLAKALDCTVEDLLA